jgi:uncharacterized membrane protein
MALAEHVARWAGARASEKMSRSLPWIGTAIALLTIAAAVRRKGLIRGAVDTGLNAVPVLGAVKNVAEVIRGRDFIADRPALS